MKKLRRGKTRQQNPRVKGRRNPRRSSSMLDDLLPVGIVAGAGYLAYSQGWLDSILKPGGSTKPAASSTIAGVGLLGPADLEKAGPALQNAAMDVNRRFSNLVPAVQSGGTQPPSMQLETKWIRAVSTLSERPTGVHLGVPGFLIALEVSFIDSFGHEVQRVSATYYGDLSGQVEFVS